MDRSANSSRLNGLDTLRAIAILLVLIFHYRTVVSSELLFGFITRIGWVGVDLFFVLSGYLIGDQILRAYSNRESFSFKNFYARRLLRTLPNYYVVFSLYLVLPTLLNGTYTAPVWQFFSFTQNLDMRPGETFTHSWSLCVEEQFYLLFPLIAFLALGKTHRALKLWMVLSVCFFGTMLTRAYMLTTHGGANISSMDYYEFIYYPSYSRFDELLPGIAIALVKNYHQSVFEKLRRHGNIIFVASLISTGTVCYLFLNLAYHPDTGTSSWIPIIGYSLLSLSFALLVLAALSPHAWLHQLKIPAAADLAIWSYAIYLIHKPLYLLLMPPVKSLGISTDGYLGMGIIVFISSFCGWVLFKLVETPFMKLRERWVPSNNRTDMSTKCATT
jgi:peptidoglycan/LPS O-acetylase OafA/YrhL